MTLAFDFASHAAYSACSTTTTRERMTEWPTPHSSAQMTGYVPVFVGFTRIVWVMPGTASPLMPNSGTQKSWITSRARRLSCACLPTGSTRLPVSMPSFG